MTSTPSKPLMKILIISPGKAHAIFLKDYIYEFEMRLSPYFSIEWAFPDTGEVKDEAKKIVSLIKSGDKVFLLDERGKKLTTPDFSKIIDEGKNESAKRLVFIIGGAYGVSDEVREKADTMISLSDLVFPHMLVRVILIEQLYRANSVLIGGKYHHGQLDK